MSKKVEFEVVDHSSNAIVARSPGRHSRGVLLQGDTLRIMLGDLGEIKECARNGRYVEAAETANAVHEQLSDLLCHYERALAAHGLPLPYVNPVMCSHG
jgi:hypothetical protein